MICSLRNVHYCYKAEVPVLRGINADFAEGQVVAVCGSNGAGKSTLLDIVALDRVPDRGDITLFGKNAMAGNAAALRRQIGMLPQNPHIFSGTVMDNMLLGLRFHKVARAERRDIALQGLRRFGLLAAADMSTSQLSGGQKQRLALARLLVLRPRVLLLDEPFTHLDAAMIGLCTDILRNLEAHGLQCAVFTTHDSQYMSLAHTVMHLSGGVAATAASG